MELNVYYNTLIAGYLTQIKTHDSNEYRFEYDEDYRKSDKTLPLGYNLPKNQNVFSCKNKLPPFFDNLVSEGWLRENQTKALELKEPKEEDKYSILTHFGHDLIGAISITPKKKNNQLSVPRFVYVTGTSSNSYNSCVSIESNSTISGVQKKVLVKKLNDRFLLTNVDELSTHIAKLESETFPNLIELEFLSTNVMKTLLPDDEIQTVKICFIDELNENALVVERFDRYNLNNFIKRKHFEEFNQILNKHSDDKYNFSYDEMGYFMRNCNYCKKEDILKLFKRILACILIGNTDAHLKNFSMFHNEDGSLSLTPMYDIVASSYYEQFDTMALTLNGIKDVKISDLKPKHIVDFAENSKGFGLNEKVLIEIYDQFKKNKQDALKFLQTSNVSENVQVKNKLIEMIQKRWNGTFDGIKLYLQKKRKK